MGPLDHPDAKAALKEDKAIAKNSFSFSVSVSTAEDARDIPIPKPFIVGDTSEELSQVKVLAEGVVEQIAKLHINKQVFTQKF